MINPTDFIFFKIFFWCGPFFKVFIELVAILLLFYEFFWLWGMSDLSFPTRDQACASYIGRQSLNHWATRKVPPLTLYIAFQQDQFLEAVPFFCTESLYALFLDFGIMTHTWEPSWFTLWEIGVWGKIFLCFSTFCNMDSNLSLKYYFFYRL